MILLCKYSSISVKIICLCRLQYGNVTILRYPLCINVSSFLPPILKSSFIDIRHFRTSDTKMPIMVIWLKWINLLCRLVESDVRIVFIILYIIESSETHAGQSEIEWMWNTYYFVLFVRPHYWMSLCLCTAGFKPSLFYLDFCTQIRLVQDASFWNEIWLLCCNKLGF